MKTLDRKWWTLIAVCTATFMLLLDITVVNVALPDIQSSLHSTFSDLQWVVDAYSLTLAAFLLTAGVLGDMFGRRGVFAIGLGVFSLASLSCGLSDSSLILNLSRGAQGIGGAIMFATSLALIAQAFQGRERATAFGIYGAVLGGAVAVGPLVGGAITSGIGWRWIFFVNVPIGAVAILTTLTRIEPSREPNQRRIDWIGFVTFSAALFCLVFALVRGNDAGWHSPQIIGLLAGSAVLLVLFVVAELRQRQPMLDLSLFRRPAMVGVSITTFAIAASIFAMFLYLTLYIQDDLGYGPLAAGVRFLPITMLAFVVAPFAGKMTARVPARILMGTGLLLVAVGCLLMAFTHTSSGWTVLLPGFVVSGIGIGIANPSIASSSVAVVPHQQSGMASGSSNTFRQVGIATGIAGLGAVFQSQIQSSTLSALRATPAGRQVAAKGGSDLVQALTGGEVRLTASTLAKPDRSALLSAYRVGFSITMDHLMLIAAVIALMGSAASYLLVRQRDFAAPSWEPAASRSASGGQGEEASGDGSEQRRLAELVEVPEGAGGARWAPPETVRRSTPGGPSPGPMRARPPALAKRTVSPTSHRNDGKRRVESGRNKERAPDRATAGMPLVDENACRSPGRPRDERADQAIAEAALRQVADLGYARVTMESVAVEAGVSRATIYRRHRDKADLVTAAIASTSAPLPPDEAADPKEELVKLLAAFDRRFAEHCIEVIGALLGNREDPGAMALHRQRVVSPRMAVARSLLERAQSLGQLDPSSDLDLAVEMLMGVVFTRRISGRVVGRDWARHAVDLVWTAMAPPPRKRGLSARG